MSRGSRGKGRVRRAAANIAGRRAEPHLAGAAAGAAAGVAGAGRGGQAQAGGVHGYR